MVRPAPSSPKDGPRRTARSPRPRPPAAAAILRPRKYGLPPHRGTGNNDLFTGDSEPFRRRPLDNSPACFGWRPSTPRATESNGGGRGWFASTSAATASHGPPRPMVGWSSRTSSWSKGHVDGRAGQDGLKPDTRGIGRHDSNLDLGVTRLVDVMLNNLLVEIIQNQLDGSRRRDRRSQDNPGSAAHRVLSTFQETAAQPRQHHGRRVQVDVRGRSTGRATARTSYRPSPPRHARRPSSRQSGRGER